MILCWSVGSVDTGSGAMSPILAPAELSDLLGSGR